MVQQRSPRTLTSLPKVTQGKVAEQGSFLAKMTALPTVPKKHRKTLLFICSGLNGSPHKARA